MKIKPLIFGLALVPPAFLAWGCNAPRGAESPSPRAAETPTRVAANPVAANPTGGATQSTARPSPLPGAPLKELSKVPAKAPSQSSVTAGDRRMQALLASADSVDVEVLTLKCVAAELGAYPYRKVESASVAKLDPAKLLLAVRDLKVVPVPPREAGSCFVATSTYSPFVGLSFDKNKKTRAYLALSYNSTDLSYLDNYRDKKDESYLIDRATAQRFRQAIAQNPKIIRALRLAAANPKYPGIKANS